MCIRGFRNALLGIGAALLASNALLGDAGAGMAAFKKGDYQAAFDLYQEALAIARQIGSRESELIYLSNLAAARLEGEHVRDRLQRLADLRPMAAERGQADQPLSSC